MAISVSSWKIHGLSVRRSSVVRDTGNTKSPLPHAQIRLSGSVSFLSSKFLVDAENKSIFIKNDDLNRPQLMKEMI